MNQTLSRIIRLIGAALMVAALLPAAASASNVYEGTWVAVDDDGSNMVLVIEATNKTPYSMTLIDDADSLCNDGPMEAISRGTVSEAGLTGRWKITCDPAIRTPRYLVLYTYNYDSTNPQLIQSNGVVWTPAP